MKPTRILSLSLLLTTLLLLHPAQPASAEAAFSHSDWDAVLKNFVDQNGRVDYAGLERNRGQFDRYVQRIQTTSPDSDPSLFPTLNDELAYWINAYNAQVFLGVLDWGTDIDSVWSGLISGRNFFMKRKIILGGQTMSLKRLEDKIVRQRYQDPRIHAALNCASIGCPILPRDAFLGSSLDRQLDQAMTTFVSEPRNVRVLDQEKRVELSKIFDWFSEDFEAYEERKGGTGKVLDYINRYRTPGQQIPTGFSVAFTPYDKRLNRSLRN